MKRLIVTMLFMILAVPAAAESVRECVVLLHGLGRTAGSMDELERKLQEAGYTVTNISYPSRNYPVEELSWLAVGEGLQRCSSGGTTTVHFVTHSLGSILVRYYFANRADPRLGRVVMLGPPNQGSELVDALGEFPGFGLLNGPSGDQLGTGDGSVPESLGAVNFELGVIAGNQSLNPLYTALIPGPDDGKVSVESTRVEGMTDHIILPVTHTWMMFNDEVIDQVLYFLAYGRFLHQGATD
ncbi:MAG: alpha/beta hydrolase [Gammaproteobacteria bacterium]